MPPYQPTSTEGLIVLPYQPTQKPTRWRLQSKMLSLLALLALLGCDGGLLPSSKASQLYSQHQEAQQRFQAKQYEEALRIFLDLQSKDPESRLLMYNLGATYYHLAKGVKEQKTKDDLLQKAEASLKRVLDKASAALRQKAHYNLGLLYTDKKQYEEALYHFSTASHLAKAVIKEADPDAEKNHALIAQLLRQRKREQQELSRSRVFRYDEKRFRLRASQPSDDPLHQLDLQGEMIHEGTQEKVTLRGYPVSEGRWELRFTPTRTGKWRYRIKTLPTPRPDGSKKQEDKALHDEGFFNVLPSARPGQITVAHDNHARFAWKKPKEAAKIEKKSQAHTSLAGFETFPFHQ